MQAERTMSEVLQMMPRALPCTGNAAPGIRTGTLDDVPGIVTLEADVDPIDSDVPGHTPYDQPYPRWAACVRWRRVLADPSYRVDVAETPRHGIVAYCSSRATRTAAWLEHIGVAREFQGTGLAARLLQDARARYPGQDLHLLVTESKVRARRFYEREGWVVRDEETPLFLTVGDPMVEYVCAAAS